MSTLTDRNPACGPLAGQLHPQARRAHVGLGGDSKKTIVGPEDAARHLGDDPEQSRRAEVERAFDDLPAVGSFGDRRRPARFGALTATSSGGAVGRHPLGDSLDVIDRQQLIRRLCVDQVLLAGRLTPFDRVLSEAGQKAARRRSFHAA